MPKTKKRKKRPTKLPRRAAKKKRLKLKRKRRTRMSTSLNQEMAMTKLALTR